MVKERNRNIYLDRALSLGGVSVQDLNNKNGEWSWVIFMEEKCLKRKNDGSEGAM